MADQSDVEAALASMIVQTLYPAGPTGDSITGGLCRVYRGWPNSPALDSDLAGGVVHVSIFPEAGQQLNTTRFPDHEIVPNPVAPSLLLSVEGHSVTLSGNAVPGQLAGILADKFAVVHRTQIGDTPFSVAAVLATMLRKQRAAILSGATVTVPGTVTLVGRSTADQQAFRETRRQRQGFRITCWCPGPASRDASASAIDAALSAQHFIPLPDGTFGYLRYVSSSTFDQSQNASLYRRDLLYNVEYATTLQPILSSMIFGDLSIGADGINAVASRLS